MIFAALTTALTLSWPIERERNKFVVDGPNRNQATLTKVVVMQLPFNVLNELRILGDMRRTLESDNFVLENANLLDLATKVATSQAANKPCDIEEWSVRIANAVSELHD